MCGRVRVCVWVWEGGKADRRVPVEFGAPRVTLVGGSWTSGGTSQVNGCVGPTTVLYPDLFS